MSSHTTIIAIVGASASGKTLLAQTIYKELAKDHALTDQLAIIEEDAYYRDQSNLPLKHREATNYDHPDAFEHELLLEHLDALRDGKTIQVPCYDFKRHTRANEIRTVHAAKVVIVEGILLLSDPALRKRFDIKVFVDTPMDICLMRRIDRDMNERGRSLKSIFEQYTATVRPMFHEFIAPSRQYADLVVTKGGMNRIAIEVLKQKIIALLSS